MNCQDSQNNAQSYGQVLLELRCMQVVRGSNLKINFLLGRVGFDGLFHEQNCKEFPTNYHLQFGEHARRRYALCFIGMHFF